MTALNPAFMFSYIWLLVLSLYSLQLSNLLDPLKLETLVLILGASLSFIFGFLIISIQKNKIYAKPYFDLNALKRGLDLKCTAYRAKLLLIFFLFGLVFEIFYFNGAPGLGLFGIGPEILYTDFGISGLHGLLNSLFYAICIFQYSRLMFGISKKYSLLLIFTIIYPYMMMSRQVLISVLIQYLLIYIAVKKINIINYIKIFLVIACTLLAFGYLGDIRSGREHILFLSQPNFDYPDWLPSAFIWVYIYLCTPLNNVNHNININPNYFPLETGSTLIPTFARQTVIDLLGGNTSQWELVTESFNVSSLLQSTLTDFGILGSMFFFLMCGIIFSIILKKAINNIKYFLILIVILHGLALSFFANLLFHLVFLFEMLAFFWIFSCKDRVVCKLIQ